MRYTVTTTKGKKICLTETSILDIPNLFSVEYQDKKYPFTWKDIRVESTEQNAPGAGAIIGMLIGIFLGTVWIIVGGIIGAVLGWSKLKQDELKVKREQERIQTLMGVG